MKHGEGTFIGQDNHEIYYQFWLPADTIQAILVISHGLAEHGGRFMNVVNHFLPLGYAVYSLDHRGHGRSGGLKGYVERFAYFVTDLHSYIGIARDRHPGSRLFLLGHSVGGTIALAYALRDQGEIDGLILSAPTILTGESVSPALIVFGRILSRLTPRLGLYTIDSSAISRDGSVVQAYRSDPLVYHGKTRVRLGMEIIGVMETLRAQVQDIRIPVLLLHGTQDRLSDPAGSDMLYDILGSPDKTYRRYEGFYHEILNEPGREEVLSDIENWLRVRLEQ